VTGLRDLAHLLGEGFDRMARNKPGGFDFVAVIQAEQAWSAYLAGKKAARNVEGGILTAVRTEPAGNRVDVDPKPARICLLAALMVASFPG
jgi:hypothetical protein